MERSSERRERGAPAPGPFDRSMSSDDELSDVPGNVERRQARGVPGSSKNASDRAGARDRAPVPFVPRRTLTGAHAMTLYGWGNPRYFPNLPPPTRRLFQVDHDTRVAADCHWQPQPWTRPTLITLHGLNGSSDAHYMRGLAAKAFARGMNAVRLNQRHCGGTEHLASGLFHCGLTADAAYVVHELTEIDRLRPLAVAGCSL